MKHLKNFQLFEAVIIPTKIEDNATVNSFESAVEFGNNNGFDVVGLLYFTQLEKGQCLF
jgi:hypothetical protein